MLLMWAHGFVSLWFCSTCAIVLERWSPAFWPCRGWGVIGCGWCRVPNWTEQQHFLWKNICGLVNCSELRTWGELCPFVAKLCFRSQRQKDVRRSPQIKLCPWDSHLRQSPHSHHDESRSNSDEVSDVKTCRNFTVPRKKAIAICFEVSTIKTLMIFESRPSNTEILTSAPRIVKALFLSEIHSPKEANYGQFFFEVGINFELMIFESRPKNIDLGDDWCELQFGHVLSRPCFCQNFTVPKIGII